jgi:hypothetical protein
LAGRLVSEIREALDLGVVKLKVNVGTQYECARTVGRLGLGVAALMLTAACGGGSGSAAPAPAPSLGAAPPGEQAPNVAPTIPPDAEFLGSTRAVITAYTDQAGFVSFTLPSKDVGCTITQGTEQRVSCQVKDFAYTVGETGSCPSGAVWGGTAQLITTAGWACTTDHVGGDKVLEYGARVDIDNYSCVSRPDGITCRNATTDHGFRLAKAFYTFF